jgi:hypothetical protein
MPDRLKEWDEFQREVERHIRFYTLKQYWNPEGDEQVDEWNYKSCIDAIKRYVNRAGRGARSDEEQLRDCLKIAHYACFAYFKWMKEADLEGVDLNAIAGEKASC